MAAETTPFVLRLDEDDRALLDSAAQVEKLDRSTVLRRALRSYATELGVTNDREPERRRGSGGKRRR